MPKGPGTLPIWKNREKQFQGIRKSQGIGFSRTSFLSFPATHLTEVESERVKQNRSQRQVGQAHTGKHSVCILGGWLGMLSWTRSDQWDFPVLCKRHPKVFSRSVFSKRKCENSETVSS